MAYEKQTWVNGETITQEKLNHMEDGIANAGGGGGVFVIHVSDIDYQNYTAVVDKTYAEAFAAFNDGQPFFVVEETQDIQYGRSRYCGAAHYVRQIGYPDSYIEVSFLLHNVGFVNAELEIKEDGSVRYAENPIQNA